MKKKNSKSFGEGEIPPPLYPGDPTAFYDPFNPGLPPDPMQAFVPYPPGTPYPIPFAYPPGTTPPLLVTEMPPQVIAPVSDAPVIWPWSVPSTPSPTSMPPQPFSPYSPYAPGMPMPPSGAFVPPSPGMLPPPASAYQLDPSHIPNPSMIVQPPKPLNDRVYYFLQDALTSDEADPAQDLDLLDYCLAASPDSEISDLVKKYVDGQAAMDQIRKRFQPQINAILDVQMPLRMKRPALAEQKAQAVRAQDLQAQMTAEQLIAENEDVIGQYAARINEIVEHQNAELAPFMDTYQMDLHALVMEYIERHPAQVLVMIQDALVLKTKSAQAQIDLLTAQHQAEIDEDHLAFKEFFDEKVMNSLKRYTDAIAACQNNTAVYQKMIADKTEILNALSNKIQGNMEALGNVIGFLCHQKGIDQPTLEQVHATLSEIGSRYAGYYKITMDVGPIASLLGGGSPSLYEGPDAGERAADTIRFMSDLTDQTRVLQDTWVPLAQSQIKLGQDAIQYNVDGYTHQREAVEQDWFVQATLREYQDEKQKDLLAKLTDQGLLSSGMPQSKINEVIAQQAGMTDEKKKIRAINDHVLELQRQLKILSYDLEAEALREDGVELPEFMSFPYEEKRAAYFGVCGYVNEHKENFSEITKHVNELSESMKDRDPNSLTEEDRAHLQIGKQAMHTIMLANHVKLRLEDDHGFIDQLRDDPDYGHMLDELMGKVS